MTDEARNGRKGHLHKVNNGSDHIAHPYYTSSCSTIPAMHRSWVLCFLPINGNKSSDCFLCTVNKKYHHFSKPIHCTLYLVHNSFNNLYINDGCTKTSVQEKFEEKNELPLPTILFINILLGLSISY